MKIAFRLALVALVVAGASAAARADDDDDDHDRARQLVEDGRIKPLDEILARIAATHPGEVISVELDEDDGHFIYEIDILTADGRRLEVEVDAADATVLKDDDD